MAGRWQIIMRPVLAAALAATLAFAPSRAASPEHGGNQARDTLTVKERLGAKATDEQRVDNCKVPPELRGPKFRPDLCPGGAAAASGR
jgi:hypothetical protein